MSATKPPTLASYLLIYFALIALATISLFLSFLHWQTGDLAISMSIAAGKGFLVVWFFMHLAEERFSSRLAILVSLLLMVLLITLTAADVATRQTFPRSPTPAPSSWFHEGGG